jgi:hypothetical protein
VTQTNTATAEESTATSEALAAQAELLKEMVEKFKLQDSMIDSNDGDFSSESQATKCLVTRKAQIVNAAEKQQLLNSKKFGKY